jgi:hypothetical protein
MKVLLLGRHICPSKIMWTVLLTGVLIYISANGEG